MRTQRWIERYLHPGEGVIHLIFHSWVDFFGTVFGSLAMAALPLVAWYLIPGFASYVLTTPMVRLAAIVLGTLYFLGLLLFTIIRYVNYHLDFWIITTERLISVEQRSLFAQIVAEQELGTVQDITSEVHGLLATVLSYGNVQVRTASERPPIILDVISNPHGVRRELFKLIEQRRAAIQMNMHIPGPSPLGQEQ